MGGLFDDIFDDGDFEISSDKDELDMEETEELNDDWNDVRKDSVWDTGQKQDLWNADEPWTCHSDCDPSSDKQEFDMEDYFS